MLATYILFKTLSSVSLTTLAMYILAVLVAMYAYQQSFIVHAGIAS